MSEAEQTLSIIKPDAVERNLEKEIKTIFEKSGLKIINSKKINLSKEEAADFYKVHQTKPFYDRLCSYLSSGPIIAMILEGSNAIKKNREFILLNLDKKLDQIEHESFKNLIIKRSKGKPLAYLTGVKSFWNYDFRVNEKVLIPRPDSELIVEQVLKIYKYKKKINFLEIGVGSGCLILSILKEKKSFLGTGIDLSQDCIEICRYNAKKLDVNNRIKLIKSDVDNLIFH